MATAVTPAVAVDANSRTSSKSGGGPRGYSGPLLDNKPHGLGKQEYRDGSVYCGPFIKGIREGPGGQFSFSNGDTYVGQFKNGDKDGRGEYRWCDGSFYNGRWANDRRSGPNEELTIASLAGAALRDHFIFSFHARFPRVSDILETVLGSELQYRGGFNNDAVHGDGEMIFTCGATFTGRFQNGMEHGQCKLTICDGVSIEGEWFEGEVQTLVRVFADSLFPTATGKPATNLSDTDVKDLVSLIYSKRGLSPIGSRTPQRFSDAFTRTRQLAAQAAAEGVFGRPAMTSNDTATAAAGAGFASPVSRDRNGFDVAAPDGTVPISSAGYVQLSNGVANMRHPVPISAAGYAQIDRGAMSMRRAAGSSSNSNAREAAAWAVGGALTEWVEPIDLHDDGSVKPSAWWRTYGHRERRRMNQSPARDSNGNSSLVTWNTVGNAVTTQPRQREVQELKGQLAKRDMEVDAVISNPLNQEDINMLKDMPTRADVIQRIIDSAAAKRKLVRCGIAVSLADCEVCSAFTNRVWWYLRTKMHEPGVPAPSEVPPEGRRVVRVLDVAPGGAGELWGLTRGDAVVAYCGFPAWEHTVLRKKQTRPGDIVSITIVRRTFDGNVEQAADNQATTEPPTKMEEFASNERVIEKTATVGCNVSRADWELLRSIPIAMKSSSSWMQEAEWADLKNLLKRVRAIQVSARPEVWANEDGTKPAPEEL